jgi:hypothetical protein
MFDDLLNDVSGNWEIIQKRINDEKELKERTEIFETFFNILDNIVKLNKINRKSKKWIKNEIGLYSYFREYCTIKLDIGRQIGKTQWIKRRYKKEDIIVVSKEELKKKYIYDGFNRKNIVTAYKIKHGSCRGKKCNDIYVDDCSYMINKIINLNDLYIELGNNIDQTFILLG